jgi:PAS domain S-box-containing protein
MKGKKIAIMAKKVKPGKMTGIFSPPKKRLVTAIGAAAKKDPDITKRKRAEDVLRESEERLRDIMFNMADWVWEVDENGVYTYSSQKSTDIFDRFPEEIIGKTPFDLMPPDEAKRVAAIFSEIAANKAPIKDLENWNIRKNGERFCLLTNAVPILDAAGNLKGYRGVDKDITEAKRVEQRLRESEEKYKVLFEGSSHGILATDIETKRFVFANPSMCRMLGYSAAELLQLGVLDIHPKDTQAQVMSEMEIQIRKGESLIHDIPCLRKDGTVFFADIGGGSTVVNGRRLVVGFFADVTERKRAEEEIRRTSKELQEKNDELNRFVFAVSHDLRSPLVTIQTFQGHLEQDVRSRDAGRMEKDLGYIRNAADKMGRMLDELLRLSRVGRMINPSEEVPLQAIVKEALDLVAGRITARGVRVDLTEEPIVLYGDRTRLVEVFQNLVDNSAKFMGDQPAPRVEIGVEQAGEELVLYVRDNGIGIGPEVQPLVFGLFHKLDPGAEGEGIGLALVRRIVELHGGRIWLESEGLGKGTTFRFTLAKTRRGVGREERT